MDFDLSEEQRALRADIITFAASELSDDIVRRDIDGDFPKDGWKRCAAQGIQGLPIPKEYGGGGADALTNIVAMEALGYGCADNGLIFALNAQMWSCESPIMRFGSEAQRQKYLPRLCDGSIIGVQAMTEPDSGSDAFSMATTAVRRNAGYVLTGQKTFITNAPVADVFVVFGRTNPDQGFAGITAFLVERDDPGLTVGRPFEKMGLRTTPMSDVRLDECYVDDDRVLGPAGAGMAVFNHSMAWERSCILASAIGTMERQVERCIAYAQSRHQFGRPIGHFQAVSHRIVDMKVRLETARLLLYRQGSLLGVGRPSPLHAAMVKLHVSESFVQSSLDALQIHGANGYMREFELERELRDAIGSRIYSGTSDMQRNVIAGLLGI